LVACFIAFLVSFQLELHNPCKFEAETVQISNVPSKELPDRIPEGGTTFKWSGWIGWGWLSGVGFMTIRLLRNAYQAHGLKYRQVSSPAPDWQKTFEELLSEFGLPRKIQLLQSRFVSTPMVVGCLSPIVLVPVSAFTSLTPNQLRAILLHELAHIRRLDHWVNLFQGVIESLLFFHPAVWWLSNKVRDEREHCCDEFSVTSTGQPKDLAEALFQLESLRTRTSSMSLAATGGKLKERIARILQFKLNNNPTPTPHRVMKTKNIGTLIVTLLLTGGLFFLQAGERTSKEEYATEKTPDWTKDVELSGSFRLGGKDFTSLVTPEGNFWVEEGKFASGYKLIELDISQSQPSALIQKGDQQAWFGLRTSARTRLNDKEFAKGKLSREDAGETPKIAYFKTNGGNYGKLLFQWQNRTNNSGKQSSYLLLEEIVIYDARSGKGRTINGIMLGSAGHMDLDSGIATGTGTRLPGDYSPDLHFSNVDGVTMYIRGIDGASFLFPVSS
jgi:beta-lactamase regulating signal transducer with metallopeptidase domain